ncbi:MAG: PKD domain-containing protein [Chitinispirillia bacterium]|jgi:PKD repeat protein
MDIWHVSTTGSSSNSGTAASPLDSIDRALDNASPGDTIKIAAGNYALTGFSYIQDSALVIFGGYSDNFSIRNSDSLLTLFDAQNTYSIEVQSNGKNVIIDGITFKNKTGDYFLKLSYTDSATISNCRFIQCYKGVDIHETYNSKIFNNIFAFDSIGIHVDYYGSNIDIINNTFCNNTFGVLEGEMTDDILIKNNIFAFNQYGIHDSMAATDTITYNSFYENAVHYRDYANSEFTDVALIDTCLRHSNSYSLNPDFMDTAYASYDFHLSTGSQCVDSGDPGLPYASEPSPNGGRINLGAYGNTQWAAISGTVPTIISMPLSDTVEIGGSALFSVSATGTPSLSYQWQKNGSDISGAIDSTYSINPVAQSDSGWYKVAVSTIAGDVVSDSAYLFVPVPVVITSQPTDTAVMLGNPFSLSISATGQPPLEFKWLKSGTDSSGASDVMSIGNAAFSDTGFYICKVYNQFDTLLSDTANISVHSSPVADFTGSPTSGIDTVTVFFTDQSTGTNNLYIWNFGDGTIDTFTTQTNVSHFYSALGNYNVSLTVRNLTFNVDSILQRTEYISVVSKSVSTFSGVPATGIDSLTVQFFLDSVSPGVSEWIWTYGDGAIDTFSSAVNPTHYFGNSGTYDVKLKVSGPGGTDSTVRSQYIKVYTRAVSNFTASDTIGYAPFTVNFFDSSTGDIDSWRWEFGDDYTDSSQSPTHEYTKRGTFNVKLIVSGFGGNDTLIRNNYITALNTPPVIYIAETDSLLEDSLEVISVNVTDINNDTVTLSFIGDAPDGMIINQDSHTLSWTPGNDDVGFHIFTLIADDNQGGKDTAICTLTVYNTNDFPVIDSIIFPDTTLEDSLMSGLIIASDPDLNDSLILQIDSTITWLNISKQFINQSSWYYTVQGTPGDSDTGLIILKAVLSDREGLQTDTSWTIFVVNTNDAPETKLGKKEVIYGAVRYTFIGEDDFDSLLTYSIRIQKSGMSFDSLLTNSNGQVFLYPLSDGIYYISCYSIDSEGLADLTPVLDTLIISGVTTRNMPNDGIWNMVSIPGSSFDASPFKSAGNILHWDESQSPNGIYKYYTRAANITDIKAGHSYWIKLDSSLNIVINENNLYKNDSAIIDLHKDKFGWNQVASPYPYPVKWNSTLTLWEWDPNLRDFIESENVLYPWDGYWIHTESPGKVPIYSKPVFLNKSMSRRVRTYFVNKNEWTFRISLISNLNRDRDNLFGFSKQAHNGQDKFDRPEPPRMGSDPFIFFPHPEWESTINEFASDIRHTWKNKKNIFQVGISPCSEDITGLALTISGYESEMPIYLYINTPKKGVIQYVPQRAISLKPSNEKQYRTIFVTDDRNFLKNFPFKFALNHPYPNPCRPMTTINYTLPYRWQKNGWLNDKPYKVSMRIYDTRGRVIRELVNRKQVPSKYSVVWRGKSDTNRMVAPGFYFCRLVAGKYLSVRRIIVLP